jgi:hypothetical protein
MNCFLNNLVTLGGVQFKNTSLGDEKKPILFDKCDLEGSTKRFKSAYDDHLKFIFLNLD